MIDPLTEPSLQDRKKFREKGSGILHPVGRGRSIRGVRRYPVLIAALMVLLLAAVPRSRALTDDEKRALFLQSQQGDTESSPSPSPSPHHRRHPAEAEETPYHHHAASDEDTPEPDVTPHHHRFAADSGETPEPDLTPHRRHHHESPTPEETPSERVHEEETPAPSHHEETTAPVEHTTSIPATQTYQPSQTYGGGQPVPHAVAAPTPAPGPWGAQIDVQKQGLEQEDQYEPPPPAPVHHHWWQFFGSAPEPQYQFLTREIREAIDRAPVARNRWRFIVVHNSGTRQGNARIFDYYHRYVRKMKNGLAYHFVIGNGTSSGNGQIEIGNRWIKQLQGGHVHSDYLNNIALGICLVGDFNRDLPTKEQLESLDELIRYLRVRVGKIDGKPAIVKAHKEINPPQWPTDCPGDRFPYRWLHERFD